MSHDLSSSLQLSGQLLLAAPSLRDPHFLKSVVFLAAHSPEEGAFGYILNRPLQQRVGDLMPDEDLGPLGDAPVFMGGPVSADKLAFASLNWSRSRRELRVRTHLSVNDALHEMSMGRQIRGFVGYSGWGQGQLEKELQRRSWIISSPHATLLKAAPPEALWRDTLHQMGPIFALLADTPDKIHLN